MHLHINPTPANDGEDATSMPMSVCPRCDYSIPDTGCRRRRSKAKLMDHYLENHFNLTIDYLTCPVCRVKLYNRFLSQKTVFQMHLQQCHDFSVKIYKCEEAGCETYFNTKQMLIIHRNKHKKLQVQKSDGSRNAPNWIESLSLSPYARDKLSQRISCNFGTCKDVFFCEGDLEAHSKLHGEFQCHSNSCDRVMGSVKLLFRHELSCSQKKCKGVYSCPRCEYSAPSKGTSNMAKVRKHYVQEHFSLTMDYQTCPICGRKLSNNLTRGMHPLQVHLQIFHNYSATVYKCTESGCEAYFNQKKQLVVHRNNHNVVVVVDPDSKSDHKFHCRDCDKSYRNKELLHSHRAKVHMKHLQYSCPSDGCLERFGTQEEVDNHTSTSEMMICPECGKSYHGEQGLNTHIRIVHRNDKPKKSWVCEVCGKDFKGEYHLRMHSLSHSGPESWEFACEICGKKIITQQKLKEHMRTHSKEKPFTCEFCGISYAHRHNLRIHVNNKHSDVTSDPPQKFDKSRLVSRKGIKLKMPRLEKAKETGESTRGRRGRSKKRPRATSFSSSDSNITD